MRGGPHRENLRRFRELAAERNPDQALEVHRHPAAGYRGGGAGLSRTAGIGAAAAVVGCGGEMRREGEREVAEGGGSGGGGMVWRREGAVEGGGEAAAAAAAELTST